MYVYPNPAIAWTPLHRQAAAIAICDATTGQLERISRFGANVFRITNIGDYGEVDI
jgi:hypothetical protein